MGEILVLVLENKILEMLDEVYSIKKIPMICSFFYCKVTSQSSKNMQDDVSSTGKVLPVLRSRLLIVSSKEISIFTFKWYEKKVLFDNKSNVLLELHGFLCEEKLRRRFSFYKETYIYIYIHVYINLR